MPDRLPTTTDAEPRAHRRAATVRASREEALALVDRAAGATDALALLQHASLECAAVLLGVAPRTVERVRAALEDPGLHDEAALRLARGRRKHAAASGAPATAPAPRDPDELLRAARAREGGLAVLLDAAAECAAIVFGVHPELVRRARERAARDRSS